MEISGRCNATKRRYRYINCGSSVDVEDKLAGAVVVVHDESRTGRRVCGTIYVGAVHATAGQPVNDDITEGIPADTADDACRHTHACSGGDHDGRCAAGVRPEVFAGGAVGYF